MLTETAQTSLRSGALGGKVAVVPGNAQGLGDAVARPFAIAGESGLVICRRDVVDGEAVATDIGATGCPTLFKRPTSTTWRTAGP